jgi:hypothetical protein
VIQGRRCTRQLPIPSPVSLCAADRGQPRREINAASWPDTCITYWIYPSAVMQSDQCRAESRRSRHAVVQEGLSGIRFQFPMNSQRREPKVPVLYGQGPRRTQCLHRGPVELEPEIQLRAL